MTPQERESIRALTLRQTRLEEAVAQLRIDLTEFEQRTGQQIEALPDMPPLPVVTTLPASMPPIPEIHHAPEPIAETIPALESKTESVPEMPPLPVLSDAVEKQKSGELEFQFGRWLARIGVVFGLITLISFSTMAYQHFYHLMGPWSKLTILTLISVGMIIAGLKIERKEKLLVYGRTLAGGGLACLYYTLYGATYVRQLQVIHSQVLGGLILLAWSGYVLYLAEKKKSELLSIFAIALAYFSSAITPVGDFTMVANLILSLTAVIFLVRNAWTGLSYLCLVGTYAGLLRQFYPYDSSASWFELAENIAFWPSATYLAGAWIIYTAGVFLAAESSFNGGKRMAFLCLNNGALIGLLILTSYLSGFDHTGAILSLIGVVFLATSGLARLVRIEARDVSGAYLMQGLALVTGGIVIIYSGVTRGLLITIESVFLAAAGAYSRNWIMRAGALISSLLATAFLLDEITSATAHPWVLIIGGATAMLVNAWFARREFWPEAHEVASKRFVHASAYYVMLATAILSIGIINSPLPEVWTGPVMALIALALTFSIYIVPLFELPILIQLLLLFAVANVTIPLDNSHPLWTELTVGAVTLALAAWWPRQKTVSTDYWLQPAMVLYALAMVGITACAVHPHVDTQGWMIATSLLSLGFLIYGAWARTWQFIVAGQIYLAVAVWTYLVPSANVDTFPWTWWAAAIPPAVVFLTGWLIRQWLPRLLNISERLGNEVRTVAIIYQSIALGLAIRWIFGVMPADEDTLALFVLGTALLLGNALRPSAFGLRAGLVTSLVGAANYFTFENYPPTIDFTWADATAVALFLAQPAILRRWGRDLITIAESWAVILLSSAMGWLFVSNYITASDSHNMTLAWAGFAVTLTLIGFIANERRQRWCGLLILVASIIRVGVYDFWGYSDLYKVLTFFALTVICLGLSFLYYKFGDRLKELL